MTMFKVESGISITPHGNSAANGKGRKCIYPFSTMAVGDSFFVACKDKQAIHRMQSRLLVAARRQSVKASTRKVDGGVRVWHIA